MDVLLVLLPIILLSLTAGLLIAIRLLRPGFQYYWLIAAIGSLLAWFSILILRTNIPQSIRLLEWRPEWLNLFTPELLLDRYSWSYALCLATLTLSVVLADVVRRPATDWSAWVGGMLLTALGISAVLAGNLSAMILFWTAIDLVELLILLGQVRRSKSRERVIIAFSVRLTGTFLLIWAVVSASSAEAVLGFLRITSQTSFILLFAAGLRLGVLPINQPYRREITQIHSLGTIGRMVAAAASLILVTRTAVIGVPESMSGILLILSGIAAVYGSFSWVNSERALDGRLYWILGMGAFSVASAVRADPFASLAWGEIAILSGGLIFLSSVRNQYIVILALAGLAGMTSLPYTPGWNTVSLYQQPSGIAFILLALGQSLFAAGYLNFILQPWEKTNGIERWVWIVYPWGLLLLPLTHWLISWFEWQITLSISTLLPGIMIGLLLGVWIFIQRELSKRPRLLDILDKSGQNLAKFLSFHWLYQTFWNFYFFIGRMVGLIVTISEGDGGVLWALLILVLFVAILSRSLAGG